MNETTPSRTALRVAMRRAAHQLLDRPLVLDDPYALRILPAWSVPELDQNGARETNPFGQAIRAFMVARSRFAEDKCSTFFQAGTRQYVLLGAGLDTFSWRNPFHDQGLTVFEIDHPATQTWKRELIRQAALTEPATTIYVPVDFERQSLADCLLAAGFHTDAPAFFAWLGVVPYLTLEAFRNTLRFLRGMAPGSGMALDYALPREALTDAESAVFDYIAAKVAKAGEPFQLAFTPQQIRLEFEAVGWTSNEDLGAAAIRARYFQNRSDGFTIRGGAAHLFSARK